MPTEKDTRCGSRSATCAAHDTSLISMAKLAKASPFDHLSELQRHAEEVTDEPARWMPWNYRETLVGRIATG